MTTEGQPVPERSEQIPKLPRGRGIKLSGPEVFRIALTLVALIGVIVLTKPCANAVSGFITSFDQGSGSQLPKPGSADLPAQPYEHLKPGMTEKEIEAAIERAKARAAGSGTSAAGSDLPAAGRAAGSTAPAAGSATSVGPVQPREAGSANDSGPAR